MTPFTTMAGFTMCPACLTEYREQLGIGEPDFGRLRLLCWIVQALIAGGDYFVHLAEDELERIEAGS